jgi:hypothetical protein
VFKFWWLYQGYPHLNRWEKNPSPLNFLKNKEVERGGAEVERWTIREAVFYLLLRLKILLILKSLMWLQGYNYLSENN